MALKLADRPDRFTEPGTDHVNPMIFARRAGRRGRRCNPEGVTCCSSQGQVCARPRRTHACECARPGPPAGPVAVSERSESESRQPEFRAAGAVSGPSESESAGGPGLRAYDSGPGPPARAPAGMRVVASAATGGGPGPA